MGVVEDRLNLNYYVGVLQDVVPEVCQKNRTVTFLNNQ